MTDINILAIESSCDETAVAIVTNGKIIRSNVVASQIEIHKYFGGVVPEVASRKHLEVISSVVDTAFSKANLTWDNIDAIAVTFGPGLVGALLVGVSYAKALAFAKKKPLIAVHHIEGHIYANNFNNSEFKFPALATIISGGHTNLLEMSDHRTYRLLGKTKDDAIGEAFDKVARAIGLGYPGGPKIDNMAYQGKFDSIRFPIAKLNSPYDFSFSGLKSSVLNHLNQMQMKQEEISVENIAASFQYTIVKTLEEAIICAIKEIKPQSLLLAGGVAANSHIRRSLKNISDEYDLQFLAPSIEFCTDNAAMIGAAAYYKYLNDEFSDLKLNAKPQLPFESYIN